MQNLKAIKFIALMLLLLCIGQAIYIYLATRKTPTPTRIESITEVGQGGAVYEVLYDSGGATVPFVYRYFLIPIQKSNDDALREIKKTPPFLVTRAPGAVVHVTDGRVSLETSATIYSFFNKSHFKINEELKIIKFDMNARFP